MKLIKGTDLTPKQVQEVKDRFVYRHLAIGDGKYYPTELHWIYGHAFYIRKDGHIADRPNHCEPDYLAS